MQKKDRVTMARARALKLYRSAIRLKHSLAADEEINETLPKVEAEFNRAVAAGKPFQLAPGVVFDDFDA